MVPSYLAAPRPFCPPSFRRCDGAVYLRDTCGNNNGFLDIGNRHALIRMTCICGLGDEQFISAKPPSLSHMGSWGHMPPFLAVMRVCVLLLFRSSYTEADRVTELRVIVHFACSLVVRFSAPLLLCFYFSALCSCSFLPF